MSVWIGRYGYLKVICEEKEPEAVKIAVSNLKRDFRRVMDAHLEPPGNVLFSRIVVGTLGISEEISRRASIGLLTDEEGQPYKEAFLIEEQAGELLIAGSDRRGTIYGVYELCSAWLGVSPWHFFADVPIRQKQEIFFPDGFVKADHPSVEYRGIFINDEEELEHWVQRYMGEDTIGVKTYEKIFELLLRLKLNYLWPAMHVNSFNLKRENGALAERMGIVIGTSHCDMLMRSNNREWKPWLKRKGYEKAEYDFSIPGKNREILKEYWRESVEQNRDFEVSYTLGMRGIHDSGFEAEALKGKTGEELLFAKTRLLASVIEAQQEILRETLSHETVKTFVPYKEVLELYDNGLDVPEELTLIWVNDNYGYVRRYPGEREKERSGGNGIYYHNSYWAPPGGSYLFLCSIPLAHTRNELQKAYEEGIRKIWVTNFGAIKPLEQQISFYAALAWEAGRENALTNDEELFLIKWIDDSFSGGYGKELAPSLLEFDQLTNTRKIEQMDMDAFSQTAYGDEAAGRIHRYEEMFQKVNRIWRLLPKEEQDAFFQMIAMKFHAAYFTNLMYYYADRSVLCVKQGKAAAAEEYTRQGKLLDKARRSMIFYYNCVMSNGKWNGILTPEDFPPPRTAMHPAFMPPLGVPEGDKLLVVTIWNGGSEIVFTKPAVKWFELGNSGEEAVTCHISGPRWISFVDNGFSGITLDVKYEERVLFEVDWDKLAGDLPEAGSGEDIRRISDNIVIADREERVLFRIPVSVMLWRAEGFPAAADNRQSVEDDGRICVEACSAQLTDGWKRIDNLGRDSLALLESRQRGAVLTYPIRTFSGGSFLLELHRFPSLNSVEEICVGISVDGGEIQVLGSESRDEYLGTWKENVRNNVDKLYLQLPCMEAGTHVIAVHGISKYFAFTRFVIYTEKRKENSLGKEGGNQHLPLHFDSAAFAEEFYGKRACALLPRPVLYLPKAPEGDSLVMEDIILQPSHFGAPVPTREIVERGKRLSAEEKGIIRLEAAAVLAQSKNAYTTGGNWHWCSSPSHGECGLAMYLREENRRWNPDKDAPALCYRIKVSGGEYQIWLRMLMWGEDASHFTIGIDRELVLEKELYGGHAIWRYSNEQVWKWVPIYRVQLSEGEHMLQIIALSSRLRFEQIYITKGEELPEEK